MSASEPSAGKPAAIIGQKTVGYIGNIYKYYIVCSARQKAVQQETKNSDATPGERQS
jgi:hypothetical protein